MSCLMPLSDARNRQKSDTGRSMSASRGFTGLALIPVSSVRLPGSSVILACESLVDVVQQADAARVER